MPDDHNRWRDGWLSPSEKQWFSGAQWSEEDRALLEGRSAEVVSLVEPWPGEDVRRLAE